MKDEKEPASRKMEEEICGQSPSEYQDPELRKAQPIQRTASKSMWLQTDTPPVPTTSPSRFIPQLAAILKSLPVVSMLLFLSHFSFRKPV